MGYHLNLSVHKLFLLGNVVFFQKWISKGLAEPVDIVVATPHVLLRYLQKGVLTSFYKCNNDEHPESGYYTLQGNHI